MRQNINLLEGSIFKSLSELAIPIMATSLVQMAYNMTDMIWIGRINSNAVAAVGAAGMYMWLANGLATLSKMGSQIKVAYCIGAKEYEKAVKYTISALQLGIFFGILYGFISIVFSDSLISFFKLNSTQVINDASIYLKIACGGIIFSFINQIFTGIMTAMGNSKISFLSNTAGLIVNIILDPVLIFGVGIIPEMGVMGAAIATVIAQAIVMIIFIVSVLNDNIIFKKVNIFSKFHKGSLIDIIKLGFPAAVQSMIFTAISMIIARLIAGFGDAAVAVQKVGSQIESISWMTAEGFAAAVNSFIAQNFGAGNYSRVKKGYFSAMFIVTIWGVFCTVLLILFPEIIFQIFIPDKSILHLGVDYLIILGISQLFMCIEITTAGAFSGLGNTIAPSLTGIILTSLRIPMAFFLMETVLKLNGIWWSITISSILKGILIFVWFMIYLKKVNILRK